MKVFSFVALAALALWDLPPLWRAGKKKEFWTWVVLAAFAGGLLWLHFWSGLGWTLAEQIVGGG